MNNKKILFYLSGRSGSGKDSIIKRLLRQNPNIKLLVPYTTREMRVGEREGVEYFFMNNDKFLQLEKEGKLLDHKIYHVFNSKEEPVDNHYGYPKPIDSISIITGPWDAYTDIRKNNPDTSEFKLVPIFVTPEHEYELLYRVIKREARNKPPKFKEVARRFCADQEVYPKINEMIQLIGEDHVIININLNASVEKVNLLINKYLKEENML